jgi:hypothetical protein
VLSARLQFGRCAVAKFFDKALDLLKANQKLFSAFAEHRIGFDQAQEVRRYGLRSAYKLITQYYTLFEQNKVAKTVFDLESS